MRILVVEDERKVANFVRQGLQEEGHAVDVAAEGAAALDLRRRARHGGEAGAGFGRLRRTR